MREAERREISLEMGFDSVHAGACKPGVGVIRNTHSVGFFLSAHRLDFQLLLILVPGALKRLGGERESLFEKASEATGFWMDL